MGELKLVQNEEKLMTVQQLAEKYEVSARTIRRWIADAELDAVELRLPVTGGKPIPLYSGSQMDAHVQSRDAQGLKSETSKLKFMIGHVELEGTEEQRIAIRGYIDGLHAQVEQLTTQNREQLEFFDSEYTAWNQCEMDYQDEVAKLTERAHIAEDEVQALRDPEYRKREQKRTKWWKDFIRATR
jgi:hypothetical protein